MRGNRMWFGAMPGRMRWVPAPKSPAEASSQAWNAGDTYLNGGGFERHSWGSHKRYIYEWPESSSREAAQIMKSYRDGSFGKGLIYFIDPLTYDTNILPAQWADPSMTTDLEGGILVEGVEPTSVPTSGGALNDLPVNSAFFDLNDAPSGYRGDRESLFVPIPEGYTLYLGAFYQATGSGTVSVAPVDSNGNTGTSSQLPATGNLDTSIFSGSYSGGAGVRIWVGKTSGGAASVTLTGMVARIYETGKTPPTKFLSGPWVGGMGHSGCRFVGVPTLMEHSAVNDGQVSYAASFKEVGMWL